MTSTEQLITIARRYLMDNHHYWADRYTKERTGNDYPYTYTDSDYNLFPRYQVLSAILDEVETLVGKNDLPFEDCRAQLDHMAHKAQTVFTEGEQHKIALTAMQEERDKFSSFIRNVSQQDLQTVEPLPFRRRLTKDEKETVRGLLYEQWNFQGDYWNPLEELSPQPTIFVTKDNLTEQDYELIIAAVQQHTTATLYEITEDGTDSEIEPGLFHPNCYETFYFDKQADWVIYGSHESTITFGGPWLLAFIEQLFADRREKLNQW